MIILRGPFLLFASIPALIVVPIGRSFYTISTLCGSYISVNPHRVKRPEGIPGLSNSVADVASGSSVVSNSTTKICELVCVWQGIILYFFWGGILNVQSHYFCLLLADRKVNLFCVDV